MTAGAPSWRLRRARLDESDDVAALYRRVANAEWSFVLPHTPADDRRFFRETIFGHCVVWGAYESGRIIGFCAVRRGWIDHLHVERTRHGEGVGSALLTTSLRGRRRVQLWTFQVNARSRRFYAHHGFKKVRLTDGAENEEHEPDVLLEWRRRGSPAPVGPSLGRECVD